MSVVGGLVHARMWSQRLPGKGLMPIVGKPALEHLLERMFACSYLEPERVVLATTVDDRDDPLVEFAAAVGVQCYRGSRNDVMDRFYRATHGRGFDAIVQVDGDDPCADTTYMDIAMEKLLGDDSLDIVVCRGLPLGLASKALRLSVLERVHEVYVPGDNSTGGSLYFTHTGLFKVGEVHPVSSAHVHETARVTLDEPEDLAFLEALFGELYSPGKVFGVEDIVTLLAERPELLALNGVLNEPYFERSDDLIRREHLRWRTADGLIKEIVV